MWEPGATWCKTMACEDYNSTTDALTNFSGTAPLDSITCTYSADYGLGMGPSFALLVFGVMGLALTVRTQHPAPVLVTGMLTASVIAASVPGIAAKIFAFVVFIGFAAAGLVIYQRMQSAL